MSRPHSPTMARTVSQQQEYQQLLQSLKGTVEGLLISQVSNVWNVYGGLSRLHNVMEKIFKHRCRVFNQHGEPDCWIFIQGLSWLQPSSAASPTFICETSDSFPQLPQGMTDKASIWLYRSLEGHTLSQKLSWLLSDREHLESCFEKSAYLCQEKYGEATLMCLRSVERNQPTLLTEINPCLYLNSWNYKLFQRTHRRCSSFPDAHYNSWRNGKTRCVKLVKQSSEGAQPTTESDISHTLPSLEKVTIPASDVKGLVDVIHTHSRGNTSDGCISVKHDCGFDEMSRGVTMKTRLWKSLPSLIIDRSTVQEWMCTSRKWDLTCGSAVAKSRFRLSTVGSRTLPSSPARCELSVFNKSTAQGAHNLPLPDSLGTKLSPSVLAVDYSSEVLSDSCSLATVHKSAAKDWGLPPMQTFSKGTVSKKLLRSQNINSSHYFSQERLTQQREFGKEGSSGSSDTLNPEADSKDSNLCRFKLPPTSAHISDACKQSVRPSDLKLSSIAYSKVQSTCSAGDMIPHEKHQKHKTVVVGSAPEYAAEWLADGTMLGRKEPPKVPKKSFIEDGGSSVLPMSIGFFPRPLQGQSLTSFLSSGQFARQSAELDRENAHFSISEAMIAAIEQVKCNRQLRVAEEAGEVGDESDEEINHLKQRIRIRRRQRQEEKQRNLWGVSLLSDGRTDTTTTDQSVSPISSSPGTPSESISTDDVDDLEVDDVRNLAQLKHAGLSVSMASLYSEADLSKPPPTRTGTDAMVESVVSAEGVALSLLRQFSEKQLPRASDLEWLVSEQEAPQQLLPLPTSWPVSPDEAEDADMREATPLRGTMEWAPPRPQVIFTPHPTPVRRVLMAKQNYRCAGCGMKVSPKYAHRFRYCEYLGRYFCTGCHSNQLSVIPGRILTKWDFTRCAVSNFSYRLLDQMFSDPLFRIGDLNNSLYRRARQLERTRQLQQQLFYLKDFILSCRFAGELQELIQREPAYLLNEVGVFSIQDLVQIKAGELTARLRELTASCCLHVAECQLCQARGFMCELCLSEEVIFPWQLGKVSQCSGCGTCFHTSCWTPSPCPRCTRISARRLSKEEITPAS